MLERLKANLIEDWKEAWRFWSMRLSAMGVALQTLFMSWSSLPLELWNVMPAEVKLIVPQRFAFALPALFFVASMVARVFQQKVPNGDATK